MIDDNTPKVESRPRADNPSDKESNFEYIVLDTVDFETSDIETRDLSGDKDIGPNFDIDEVCDDEIDTQLLSVSTGEDACKGGTIFVKQEHKTKEEDQDQDDCEKQSKGSIAFDAELESGKDRIYLVSKYPTEYAYYWRTKSTNERGCVFLLQEDAAENALSAAENVGLNAGKAQVPEAQITLNCNVDGTPKTKGRASVKLMADDGHRTVVWTRSQDDTKRILSKANKRIRDHLMSKASQLYEKETRDGTIPIAELNFGNSSAVKVQVIHFEMGTRCGRGRTPENDEISIATERETKADNVERGQAQIGNRWKKHDTDSEERKDACSSANDTRDECEDAYNSPRENIKETRNKYNDGFDERVFMCYPAYNPTFSFIPSSPQVSLNLVMKAAELYRCDDNAKSGDNEDVESKVIHGAKDHDESSKFDVQINESTSLSNEQSCTVQAAKTFDEHAARWYPTQFDDVVEKIENCNCSLKSDKKRDAIKYEENGRGENNGESFDQEQREGVPDCTTAGNLNLAGALASFGESVRSFSEEIAGNSTRKRGTERDKKEHDGNTSKSEGVIGDSGNDRGNIANNSFDADIRGKKCNFKVFRSVNFAANLQDYDLVHAISSLKTNFDCYHWNDDGEKTDLFVRGNDRVKKNHESREGLISTAEDNDWEGMGARRQKGEASKENYSCMSVLSDFSDDILRERLCSDKEVSDTSSLDGGGRGVHDKERNRSHEMKSGSFPYDEDGHFEIAYGQGVAKPDFPFYTTSGDENYRPQKYGSKAVYKE